MITFESILTTFEAAWVVVEFGLSLKPTISTNFYQVKLFQILDRHCVVAQKILKTKKSGFNLLKATS